MAKIRRDEVIIAGLELLDEIGLDALTTRKLAQRLGVESPTLYWHFRDKAALMSAMAAAAVAAHHWPALRDDPAEWAVWLFERMHSFRSALLAHRDGARLHAGSAPEGKSAERLQVLVDYLLRAGFSEQDARMALLTTGQFALANALEQQGREATGGMSGPFQYDPDEAFKFGLDAMIDGLKCRLKKK